MEKFIKMSMTGPERPDLPKTGSALREHIRRLAGTYEGASEGYSTACGGYYELRIRVSISDGERIKHEINPTHQVRLEW
jgi:hypothetical protein